MNIKLVQQRLNELGHGKPPLDVDGLLGPKTIAAIKKFQKVNNFTADGTMEGPQLEVLFEKVKSKPCSTVLSLRAMEYALSQEGVRERTGANDGTQVEQYLGSVGLGKGYAWCMAFIYWCYEQASRDLNVKNPLVKTGGVLNQYNTIKGQKKTKSPEVGDIMIMDYGKGLGHTGIVTAVKGTSVDTIEGNTNSAGSRNGDGVYKKSRNVSSVKSFLRITA